MKARFHVFSGTGNTWHAARHLGDLLLERGFSPEILAVDRLSVPPAERADLEVIMFPVYATGVPQVMQAYLRKFPKGNGARAAIVSTNGRISERWRDGYEGQAPLQARRMMCRRGYDVQLTDSLDYPHSITNILAPPRESTQTALIAQVMERLPALADRMARGKHSIRRCFILNQAWSWLFGIAYSLFGRRILGKLFIADARCNACGVCVQACPVRAIRLAGKRPRWNWTCQGCARCINNCPRRAIQTSLLRLLLLALLPLLYNPLLSFAALIPASFYRGHGSTGGAVFNHILWVMLYIAYMYLLDKVFFLLESLPGVRKVLELSHTRSFRRYLAPGFRPLGLGQEFGKHRTRPGIQQSGIKDA